MVDAPKRMVLTEKVYQQILRRLVDHEIEPGAKLNINVLAEDLTVSPTPVREALARLESDGLVVKRALAGYTAAPLLTASHFDDLYEMRLLLEPAAAARAAERITPEELGVLGDHLSAMRAAGPGATKDALRLFAARDAEFHDLIAVASGNRLLAETLKRMHSHRHLYRLYFRDGIAAATCREHQRIVDALQDADPDTAAAAMRSHLRRSQSRLQSAVSMDES